MNIRIFQAEANALQALANPKRLEIVHVLQHHQLTASEIQRMIGIAQPSVSQHLTVLKRAHIVVATRTGTHIRYRLSHPNFGRVATLLDEARRAGPARKHETHRRQIQDPVCGMWVEPAATKWQTLYKGATYFFCASGCQRRFVKTPRRYAPK